MAPIANDDAGSNASEVPVNRVTSFNGKLSQFLHLADGSSTPEPSMAIKRKPTLERESNVPDEQTEDTSQTPTKSKRRKQVTTTQSTNEMAYLTPPMTRSRSSSSVTASPVPVRSVTRSTTTTTIQPSTPSPIRRGRGSRTQPPTPPSSPPNLLRDVIPPNLVLLLVGVNPGIMTGATGFAYAHPSNLFWKLLHSSGITHTRHPPSDTYRLPALYSVGNTNIVERPTRDASMLSRAEMNAGVPLLEAKVAAQRPEVVGLVGKSIWEAVWRVRKGRAIRKEEFRYGWQDEGENMGRVDGESGWRGARVFVATTTSGLAATMSMAEKQAVWRELGEWVVRRREERGFAGGGAGV